MKLKLSGVVEVKEAESELLTQLRNIQNWNKQITERMYACSLAIKSGVITSAEMPDKIADIRVLLYEVDKSLEILSSNYISLAQTQTKEENDETGNREQSKQTGSVSNGQGSEGRV